MCIRDSPGAYGTGRSGTVGYYSAEELFTSNYLTPATDIFSLGVTFYKLLADKKQPYRVIPKSEKSNNFQAMASLTGADSLADMYVKYRYNQ